MCLNDHNARLCVYVRILFHDCEFLLERALFNLHVQTGPSVTEYNSNILLTKIEIMHVQLLKALLILSIECN